jgi:hypothetical protein
MIEPIWLPLATITKDIPAQPASLWTLVHEYVKGPVKLRITATGTWDYAPSKSCGPDGTRDTAFSPEALMPSALIGTLVAKVGGSPGDKPDTKNIGFIVGSYSVIALDEKTEGPLFLTMNDRLDQFGNHEKKVTVTVEEARA